MAIKEREIISLHLIVVVGLIIALVKVGSSQQLQTEKPPSQYFPIGETITAENSAINQGQGFLVFHVQQLQKKYLFLNLNTLGESAFLPDIAIYIYRDTQTTPFKTCKHEQIDSCFISQSQLTSNSQLVVIVDCKTTCKYQIKLVWSNLEHLYPGNVLKFMFAEEKSQLYHLEMENVKEFAELRLIIKPQTRRQMFDKVKIYGKYGTHSIPTTEDFDFKSIHLWQDAQGVYLQQKQLRSKSINILVVGSSQTVYVMTCEVVNKSTHEIYPGQMLEEYLEPQEVGDYHVNFKTKNNDGSGSVQFEQYVFKFSAFNGNMSMGFYLDAQHTTPYSGNPYQYMSDAQFTFQRQQILTTLPNGLYIRIQSSNRISTYTMDFVGRGKQSAIQIKENIYQITEVEGIKPQLFYFNTFYFQNSQIYQQHYSFTLHMISVQGRHGLTIRVCMSDFASCINPQTFINYSKQIHIDRYDQIGTKHTFKFQVPKSMLNFINQVEQRLMILIVVQSLIKNTTSVCALEYYSDSKYQILRQSRPIESRLKSQQRKMFKFTNVDKSIKQVRVHVNKITGIVNVLSLRQTSVDSNIDGVGKKQTASVISFKQDLVDKPIYLILIAQEDAIVSIDVQLVHLDEKFVAAIVMQEDVEFKVRLPPKQTELLEIHPVYDAIYFDFKSTGLALACQYINNKCKSQLPIMGLQGSITIPNFHQRSQLILLQNPSETKTIQLTAIYHSSDYEHCQNKQTGVVYNQIIQNRQCYSFPLTQQQGEMEVIINRLDLGDVGVAFLLCNNVIDLKKQDGRSLYRIDGDEMKRCCKDKQHKVLLVVVSGSKFTQQSTTNSTTVITFKLKLIAQYTNEAAIILPDGVAYETSKIAKQQVLQSFYYQVLNIINTTIILSNKIGQAYFTAKLVKTVDRHKSLLQKAFDFTSNSTNYFLNPVLTVTKQVLEQADCQPDCTLLIKVYSKDKIGSRNAFTIQVTQNSFILQQHKMISDFLPKDSITYFSFYNKDSGNSIYIETSDNNKKCTKIIFSDKQYPSDSNNLLIEYGNQMVYEKARNKTYFIAVQAMEDCGYGIAVSCTKIKVTHLERGKLGYVRLQQGEVRYFIIHRLTANPFKILSIHVYGQLTFYLNHTTTSQITKLFNSNTIPYQQFTIKSQHPNRLVITSDNNLCQNCYYILACVAKKNTDSSIYLGDDESFLTISEKKSVNDQFMHEGDSLKGYYYDVQDTKMIVKVHSGKLGVKISYYNQSYEKDFPQVDATYTQTITLKRHLNDFTPALIQLTALSNHTIYSIRLQTSQSIQFSQMVDQTDITPGQPNYIYLAPQRIVCLKGYWRDENESVMITADQLYKHNLQEMKVQVVVNGTELKFDKQLVRNILQVKIVGLLENRLKQAQKYSICLSSEQMAFGATVFQTEDVNILPADVQTVAIGERKYAIRPNGNFLIDVFECKGKATITYSQSLRQLPQTKPSSLSILGMPDQPHAFKIQQYLTTFLQIDSPMSTIRWLPINQQTQSGLGYLHYKIGTIKYSSTSDTIDIEWQGLQKQMDQTKMKVNKIHYVIYIANETDVLQSAQNCDYYASLEKIITVRIDGGGEQQLGVVKKHPIQKQQLSKKYPTMQDLFVSIVAQTEIQPIKGQPQHYRFLYTKQQIPKDVFVSSNGYMQKVMSIGVIVAGVIAFLIVTCVCTNKIFPLIARLKNRFLVEEDNPEDVKNEELGDLPPPSSERKTIQDTPGTEDKMNNKEENK